MKGFDGNECPCCGVQLECTGCGSTQTIDEIRAEHPLALSCCPEREMRPLNQQYEAKYKPHPVEAKMKLLREALVTLKHARVFIVSREKMHPTGVGLYDDLVRQIEEAVS